MWRVCSVLAAEGHDAPPPQSERGGLIKTALEPQTQQAIMRTPAVIALLLLLCGSASAGNPLLVPSRGLADPHVRVLGDRIYMFATHDFSHNNTDFLMCDWWVWTTHDLVRRPLSCSLSPLVSAL